MKNALRRTATVVTATGGALALFTGVAAAHYCVNESVQGKAGEAWALFGEAEDPIAFDGIRITSKGNIVGGGFVDLYVDNGDRALGEGDFLLADNMFIQTGLPVSALKAAGCDQGVGTAFPEEFGMEPCPEDAA